MPVVGRFTWREFTVPAISLNAQLLPGNPQRVSFMLSIPTVGNAFISTTGNPSVAQGIRMSGGDAPLLIKYQDLGDVVTAEWFVTCNCPTAMTCIECIENIPPYGGGNIGG